MNPLRRTALRLALVLAVAAGCAAPPSAPPSHPAPTSAVASSSTANLTAWIGLACQGLLVSFIHGDNPPTINTQEASVLQSALSSYFGDLISDQVAAIKNLQAMPPPPTEDAKQAIGRVLETLNSFDVRLTHVRDQIDKTDTSNPKAFQQITQSMTTAFPPPRGPDYAAVLSRGPQLLDAFTHAPDCDILQQHA